MASMLREAKRRKAFSKGWLVGLVLDATSTARCRKEKCGLCHPAYDKQKKLIGYRHYFSMISVAGVGLTLPFDVEPYPAGEGECEASTRLLRRAVKNLGPRFADYAVVDAEYANAPFLHAVGDLGLHVVARLKGNLPNLQAAAKRRFRKARPFVFTVGKDRVELWDADDFDPWDNLRWETVRVIRYRQYRPNKPVIEAYWLTDMPRSTIHAKQIFHFAKSRWEIENQGFNDGKNRYGMKHMVHHHENSLLNHWLITLFAIMIERLYRIRYLSRGSRPALSPIAFLRLLRISLASPCAYNTS